MPRPFQLQFPASLLRGYADAYDYDYDVDNEVAAAGRAARERGHYTRGELMMVCEWKTPRSKPLVAENTEHDVVTVTSAALATENERLRIEALRSLRGVEIPTASVLLSFAFPDRYTIIDVRALESLGHPGRSVYTVNYWLDYLRACRRIAAENGMTLRELDKALWHYSKSVAG